MRFMLYLIWFSILLYSCKIKKSLKIPTEIKEYNYEETYLPIDNLQKVDWIENRDSFIADFYSQLLVSFNEPNLYKYKGETEVFRLTLDRTFYKYSCIRIINSKNGIKIIEKETKGIGGYFLDDLNKINEVELFQTDWQNCLNLINESTFWNMPTDIDTIPESDGETWLFEANIKGNYHCIIRANPKENDVIYKIKELMFDLSKSENIYN